MSIIGTFGICSQSSCNELKSLLTSGDSVKTEELVKEIYNQVEYSAAELKNNQCSGEVFFALFHYLKTECGVDVRRGTEGIGETWRNITGDFDVIIFFEKEQILALKDTIDYDRLSQFINDFFQIDYGDAGQIAWNVLLDNFKRTGVQDILMLHIY